MDQIEEKIQIPSGFPLPELTIDAQGKVTSANVHIGEVFIYEGILGTDIFALTGFKGAEFRENAETGRYVHLERNYKSFRIYSYRMDPEKEEWTLLFRDDTSLEELKTKYNSERPCMAKIQIDNYDELIEAVRDAGGSDLSARIDRIVRDWAEDMKASVSRVKNNRYNIWLTQKYMDGERFRKFDLLDEVRKLETNADFPASLSIGVGAGGEDLEETEGYADAALQLALGRGGDQAVIKRINDISYFGGKLQTVEKSNKGKSRIVGHALTQLILQAPKIFIMGHVHSDMDSFGATLGIARLCMVNGKKPYIVIEDPNESLETVFNLAKDTEKYGFINCDKATDLCTEDSLVIVVDTHKKDIVQCPELLGISRKVVVIDHHRKADKGIEDPELIYMESYASSACEMVTEILQFMLQKKKQMEKIEAEALMAGIMVDSSFFSVRAGVRTFEAAAWLRRQGADPTEVKRFFQEDWENVKIKSKALLDADILNHGIAMASLPGERGDAQLLCAQLADRLLSLKGVRASFACGRDSEQRTVISARSLGAVNVQVIMEKLGGGGHLTNAAAQVSIPVEEALEKIRILTEETIK
ncbi:MAG: DHH family phosphoesterase [Firmicutes bacterium]|nr:DHH family phosphoesterase [Bacillota bacterium]MBQ1690417.1 DHH family phosphoesterase [Bacillota bacterium]MBQ2305293.1 DHH family phosphoesterase [Bacillota bacterium]